MAGTLPNSYLVRKGFFVRTVTASLAIRDRAVNFAWVVDVSCQYARRMRRSVTVHIQAPAERIWSLVSDVTQIGRFSPETFEAEWLDGCTGPAEGARFRGHVKRNEKGPVYWSRCTVTACEVGRRFAFTTRSRPFGLPVAPRNTVQVTWSYALDGSDGGTDVTESFELADTLPMRLYWAALGWTRGPRLEQDMHQTLHAIKATVES
jgi:uncharacterized protein YndB with AHSA1/START domain